MVKSDFDLGTIGGIPKFDQDEITRVEREWQLKQDDLNAKNKFYNSLVCDTEEDTTLDVTLSDIREKIKSLIKLDVGDDWVIRNFKDCIKSCKAYTHKLSFGDFLAVTDTTVKNINAYPPFIASSSVEVVYLSIKFDIADVMETLGSLITTRLAWERYTYD